MRKCERDEKNRPDNKIAKKLRKMHKKEKSEA